MENEKMSWNAAIDHEADGGEEQSEPTAEIPSEIIDYIENRGGGEIDNIIKNTHENGSTYWTISTTGTSGRKAYFLEETAGGKILPAAEYPLDIEGKESTDTSENLEIPPSSAH